MMALTTFNDVEDRTLRAWNRFMVFFNTINNVNNDVAKSYLKQFSNEDKLDLQQILKAMKQHGFEGLKAMISRGAYEVK